MFLKINNKTEQVLFSKIPSKNTNTPNFSGNLLFTDLQGQLLTLLKVNNGTIYKAYKNKYRDKQGDLAARRGFGNGDCDTTGGYGEICDNQLDEIILYGHNYNNNYVPVHYIYYYTPRFNDYHGSYNGNSGNYGDDYSWDYGSGGGGSENNGNDDEIKNNLTNPCATAIFKELEIEMIKKDLLQKIMQPTPKVNLTFAESILKLFNESDTFNLSITWIFKWS